MTSTRIKVARASIVLSVVVLAIKYAAYMVSGSEALLSDAIETILNVVAAVGTLWAMSVAAMPADDNHPYGHGKAEYLSAVIEGVLVVLTAIGILVIAIHDWRHPEPVNAPFAGVALNALAGLVNLAWGRTLITVGRKQSSQALQAAGEHVVSDVWATIALVIGVSLIPLLKWDRLDAVLSALVALNVMRAGFSMMKHSLSGLMDEAPSPEQMDAVKAVISKSATGALEAHDLRIRKVGALSFVEFHLVVPSMLTVHDAHEICDQIEAAIRSELGRASIHIHVEPEDKAKHSGALVLN
ncbi:cation diffusion facilitator family transporter [Gluconobacter sphaericus]|uniref:Cadmium transporter n=1 Tax=Gluconobacter sphaericus NBRC 12467 TaxID=1307951 RepID=A0AA37SE30_9PROT|nr:cation diffusion facilitator family transporter [Gluconobacter sphaericus]MBF0884665.1 cation transporter [Gluconobacter sphaericus]MBS1084637.1 cation transporter [Gluconobacter sphaericus]MBS1099807.1 cation transporter [Gluconobacter sphaericus]GBR53734.1 cation efflux system protein [Gluconobacter sphaericus NBRC 12467]GEB41316.1 cadmium transporter [Gluconobacter sphaericus NBRC 12467]